MSSDALDSGRPIDNAVDTAVISQTLFLAGNLDALLIKSLQSAGLPVVEETCRLPASVREADHEVVLHRTDLVKLSDYLSDEPTSIAVLVYTPPVQKLAQVIEKGESKHSAVAMCEEQLDAFLRVYRAHRRRVVLVDAQVAANIPDLILLEIGKRTALHTGGASTYTLRRDAAALEPSSFVTARRLIDENSALKQLASELKAGTCGILGTQQSRIAEQRLDEQRASDAAIQYRKKLEEEIKMAKLALHQVQGELETQSNRAQELQKHATDAQRAVAELNEQLLASQTAYATLSRTLESTRNALTNLKSSRSWKMTAPIRWVVDLISSRKT